MNAFITQHREKITGVISIFDRVIFKGYLPINYPQGAEKFLSGRGILLKNFESLVKEQSSQLKAHAMQLAASANRPYQFFNSDMEKKEDHARAIAKKDGIHQGLICVLAVMEHNPSFSFRCGKGKPYLVRSKPICLTHYFYYQDPALGFIHIRVPTWMPYTIQVYINGHEWLAKQLAEKNIGFTKQDNAFTHIDDPAKAQNIADRFNALNWKGMLRKFSCRVNPLLSSFLKPLNYYWVIDQAEFATDVMFSSVQALHELDEFLQRHATVCFSAEDVLIYFGRKRPGAATGEIKTYYRRRPKGARVKHVVGSNWIKMYDKHGCVLRVETVINDPYVFRVRRRGNRKGTVVIDWFPLCKRISFLFRYAQVCLTANKQYLDALSVVDDPSVAYQLLDRLCEPVEFHARQRRGLNPLRRSEADIFCAVMNGENAIRGFTNRQLAQRLGFPADASELQRKRQGARTSRLLQLLRAHGLIAKIPRSRRYRQTLFGMRAMTLAIHLRKNPHPQFVHKQIL